MIRTEPLMVTNRMSSLLIGLSQDGGKNCVALARLYKSAVVASVYHLALGHRRGGGSGAVLQQRRSVPEQVTT